jgi:hypothetical protein
MKDKSQSSNQDMPFVVYAVCGVLGLLAPFICIRYIV